MGPFPQAFSFSSYISLIASYHLRQGENSTQSVPFAEASLGSMESVVSVWVAMDPFLLPLRLSFLFWEIDTIIKAIIVQSIKDDSGHLMGSSSPSSLCISQLADAETVSASKAGLVLSQIFEF